MKQFLKFSFIGTIGFIVDSSILLYLVNFLDFNVFVSRLISFVFAVFVTWILNRNFTFSKENKESHIKEYKKYLSIQVFGAGINFSVFFTLLYFFEFLELFLIIPLAFASLSSLYFNFTFAKNKIYH